MTASRIDAEETLTLNATEAICEAMQAADVDVTSLAALLGVRRRRVVRMLRGDLTVRDLAAALDSLGRRVEMVVTKDGDTSGRISAEEGRRIVEAADMHRRRNLVYALAETMSDLDGENGAGGGMWWHLQRALAVVDAMPDLRADRL